MSYLIPKITLQPLIENAIIHGVINMGEDGEIIVSARSEEENVVISVEDNGYKQTDYEAINRLLVNEPADTGTGYGIKNVNKRIQLHFGNGYGLHYEARDTEGTKVTVVIPKRANAGQAEQ
jgi:two-component system sensor histidine kinase YesM